LITDDSKSFSFFLFCPRDIKAILERPVKEMESKQSMPLSSQGCDCDLISNILEQKKDEYNEIFLDKYSVMKR
jgi:hypothetical protein